LQIPVNMLDSITGANDLQNETDFITLRHLPDSLLHNPRVICRRDGTVFVCICGRKPIPPPKRPEGQMHVAFIDPGLRTFALVYDPVRRRYVFIGAGCYDRIRRLQKHLDDLMFRIDPANRVLGEGIPPVKHKQRRAMRKAAERMRKRIRDLIDSMHQLLVNWLCVHYDLIVYTDISAKDMVKRDGRKIGRSTARGLMTVGFARFRERLQQRAISTGRHVLIVPESYIHNTDLHCMRHAEQAHRRQEAL